MVKFDLSSVAHWGSKYFFASWTGKMASRRSLLHDGDSGDDAIYDHCDNLSSEVHHPTAQVKHCSLR